MALQYDVYRGLEVIGSGAHRNDKDMAFNRPGGLNAAMGAWLFSTKQCVYGKVSFLCVLVLSYPVQS